jgi:hypothetical protein
MTHCLEITIYGMCVRTQTSALGIDIRLNHLKGEEKRARESQVEISNTLNAEKDQPPQLALVEPQAAEVSFRQPTAAELSILTFWKLRYARSHAQELSNEFARLLNRGSSLE